MSNCFIIEDLDSGEKYKSYSQSKEEIAITFAKKIMQDIGVEDFCNMLEIKITNLEDIKTYE